MGYWITDKTGVIQDDFNNRIITEHNQLYNDNGTIYLVPRNTVSDNYTIPLGFNNQNNSNNQDMNPAPKTKQRESPFTKGIIYPHLAGLANVGQSCYMNNLL